jgi:glutamate formiminotransferase
MLTAFNHVKREAEKRGVQVVGSELVGLVPLDALTELVSQVLQLERFSASQIVEMQLATDEG